MSVPKISTDNLNRSPLLEEVIGNTRIGEDRKTARSSVSAFALQLGAQAPFNALLGASAGGIKGYASHDLLTAVVAGEADTLAMVFADADPQKNGTYRKLNDDGEAGWTILPLLSDRFVVLTNSDAETENAIVATANVHVPQTASGTVFTLPINYTTSDGEVTVSINGNNPRKLVTNSNTEPAGGYLRSGSVVIFVDDGINFRLLTDLVGADILLASENERLGAEAAKNIAISAASSTQSEQSSKAFAEANYHPAIAPDFIRTAGYASAGDGGGALYRKVDDEPAHPGKLLITLDDETTLKWYEYASDEVIVKAVGGLGGAVVSSTPAIEDAHATSLAIGKPVRFTAGDYLIDPPVLIGGKPKWKGDLGSRILCELNEPAIIWDASGTERRGWYITGLEAVNYVAAGAPYENSCALEIVSDDFVTYGFVDIEGSGFGTTVRVNVDTHTTAFGEESMLAWTEFKLGVFGAYNVGIRAAQFLNGSGTGNEFTFRGNPEDCYVRYDGIGCVVGDILVSQVHSDGIPAENTACIRIGSGTLYRSNIGISSSQFDANLTRPIAFDDVNEDASRLMMTGNNYGGLVDMTAMPYLQFSVVDDQLVDCRRAGVAKSRVGTDTETMGLFEVHLRPFTGCVVDLVATGTLSGIGPFVARASFDVILGVSGDPSVSTISSTITPSSGSGVSIQTAVSTISGGGRVEFKISTTPTNPSTSIINAQLKVSGGMTRVYRTNP